MLKMLILLSLAVNLAFAQSRYSEDDKKFFLNEFSKDLEAYKAKNGNRIDLQIIKPLFEKEVEELVQQRKITRDEQFVLKEKYEDLARRVNNTNAAEGEFINFVQRELAFIDKRPLPPKAKELARCNYNDCEAGLKCAIDPLQASSTSPGKKAGVACAKDNECASGECTEESVGSKKRVCEDVYLCYRPQAKNTECSVNPVCNSNLSCLAYNEGTQGIGECVDKGRECSNDDACCSKLCDSKTKTCKERFICKEECVKENYRPARGQSCCEGLIENSKGLCVPDLIPPVIREGAEVSPVKTIFVAFVSLFISSADAGEIEKAQTSFDKMLTEHEGSPIGTTFQWGNGTLKTLPTGNVLFTPNGGGASVELTEKTNLIKAANKSETLRQTVIESYGIDPLATDKAQNAKVKASVDSLLSRDAMFPQIGVAGISEVHSEFVDKLAPNTLNIPGVGSVTYTPAVPDSEGGVGSPSTITSPSGKVYSPASEFSKSNEYAAMTGSKLTDEDYKILQEEKEAATKTAQSAAKDGSAAAELEDEEKFLDQGVANDGLDLKSGVMANKDNLNDMHKSKEGKALDMNEKKPTLKFDRKSNFTTCDIKFKDDFYNALKKDGTFDLEIAMLAFDFVVTGNAESDYWTKNQESLYDRLKKVGVAHTKVRKETNEKIDKITKQLTCSCLDVQGYHKITNAEKKSFFEKNCAEYAKYNDPTTPTEQLSGDASGLKAKRLLTEWTRQLTMFHVSLTTDNNAAYTELLKISNWANGEAKWSETKQRNYDLFKFNIKNPSGSVAGLGAIVGALLAAGVIAILGGFATTSILSTWATVGIISASAATGAGGLWMIATLKGAWITLSPEISDTIVAPRGYSCGKKETCMEYTRTLLQPYNDICKIHTSANACIKNFVVVNEGREPRYVVDPWIPNGVDKGAILMSQPLYAEKLEQGFVAAKDAMIAKNPGASGGGGKKGGGEFVSELYLSEVFIDQNILAQYAPKIGSNLESNYFLNQEKVKLIKEAARKYAVSERFLLAEDKENIDAFADYAYEYHFVWPKKSRPGEVSYPTAGLSTYLNYMAKNVSGNLTAGLSRTASDLGKLHEQYLKDLIKNINLYKEATNMDQATKSNLAKEAENLQKELDSLLTMNAILDNKELDSQLMNLGASAIADYSKIAGANGAGLSSDQLGFLKAVGNLRSTRKDQLKELAAYNKAVAARGDKNRAARVAAATKKFSSNFASGRSSFNSGSPLFAGGNNSDSDANKNSGKDSYSGNGGYGGAPVGGEMYGAGGSLFGSGSGSGSSSNKSSEGGSATYMSGSAQADANKLADAIDARNKSSSKYQSREGLTLFEKVTNAYIRNYDKVLMKKKDKDVVEDKQ